MKTYNFGIVGAGLIADFHARAIGDIANASLMILLGYIIMGHPDWRNASIKISAVFPETEIDEYQKKLNNMIKEGRLPISLHNIELIEQKAEVSVREIINQRSQDDDLIMIGLNYETLKQKGIELFDGYNDIGNILFVNAARERKIEQED